MLRSSYFASKHKTSTNNSPEWYIDRRVKSCAGSTAYCHVLVHGVVYLSFFARIFAHLARCATAILLRPAADSLRGLRAGLTPAYTPANADRAAFNPDNCRSTRSRSFFNCLTMFDTVPIWFPLGLRLALVLRRFGAPDAAQNEVGRCPVRISDRKQRDKSDNG